MVERMVRGVRRGRGKSFFSPLTCALRARICTISCGVYGRVLMMTSLSRRSTGMPWGELMSVPRMSHMPLLVAKTTMGARALSRALLFWGGGSAIRFGWENCGRVGRVDRRGLTCSGR